MTTINAFFGFNYEKYSTQLPSGILDAIPAEKQTPYAVWLRLRAASEQDAEAFKFMKKVRADFDLSRAAALIAQSTSKPYELPPLSKKSPFGAATTPVIEAPKFRASDLRTSSGKKMNIAQFFKQHWADKYKAQVPAHLLTKFRAEFETKNKKHPLSDDEMERKLAHALWMVASGDVKSALYVQVAADYKEFVDAERTKFEASNAPAPESAPVPTA